MVSILLITKINKELINNPFNKIIFSKDKLKQIKMIKWK